MKTFTIPLEISTYSNLGDPRTIETKTIDVALALRATPPRFCLDCGHKTVYFCSEQHTPPTADLHHFYQVCIDCGAIYHVVACGSPRQFKDAMIAEIKKIVAGRA